MPSSPGASGAVFEWGGLLASEAVEVSVRRRRQPGFHQRPALGERIGAGSPPVCGDRLSAARLPPTASSRRKDRGGFSTSVWRPSFSAPWARGNRYATRSRTRRSIQVVPWTRPHPARGSKTSAIPPAPRGSSLAALPDQARRIARAGGTQYHRQGTHAAANQPASRSLSHRRATPELAAAREGLACAWARQLVFAASTADRVSLEPYDLG